MLPFDQKKMPAIVGSSDSDDIMGEAVKRSMSRLINAIQSQNVAEAVEAWETLCALKSTDD
jgi:hypothetical protein